jgi:glycerophosphoryl diester phosphodiesterase
MTAIRILAWFCATCILSACSTPFDLQGHRGARGLAPENTLPAFERALNLGVSTLELDTGLTADGVVVVAHDLDLSPDFTRNMRGEWISSPTPSVRSLMFKELQTYDVGRIRPDSNYARRWPHQTPVDGTRVPRLRDVFALVKARGDTQIRFNIETKIDPRRPLATVNPETFVQRLLEDIRAEDMEARVTIQSFDWRTLRLVQGLSRIPTVYLTAQQAWLNNIGTSEVPSPWTAGLERGRYASVPAMVQAAGGTIWSPYFGDLDEDGMFAARQLGLRVIPWTVNDPRDMRRMLALKVDGLITDYPDRALPLLQEYGLRARP